MKIRLSRKTITKGLLGFIGVQALVVVGGLCQRYLLPQKKPVVKGENRTISICREDFLYGVITSDRNPIEPIRDKGKVLHIVLAGTTTSATSVTATVAPSGDILHASLDFLI